jgi:hypothetical protein
LKFRIHVGERLLSGVGIFLERLKGVRMD